MKLKRTSYSKVINGSQIVIIESEMLNEKYINLKDKSTANAMQLGEIVRLEPMSMSMINHVVKYYFDEIEYIDVMSTARFHKVISE